MIYVIQVCVIYVIQVCVISVIQVCVIYVIQVCVIDVTELAALMTITSYFMPNIKQRRSTNKASNSVHLW